MAGNRLRSMVAGWGAISLPALVSRAAGIAGLALIAASTLLAWFEVPVGSFAPNGEPAIVAQSPGVCFAFKACAVVVLFLAMLTLRTRGAWRTRLGRVLVVFLSLLLLFPYAVTNWSPEIAGRASWIQAQHESLTSQNGDLFSGQEEKDTFWRQRVGVVNRLFDSAVVRLPDWGSHVFRWERFAEITQWFGMSSWFAAFVRRGWTFALAGTVLLLIALCRECADGPLKTGIRFARLGASCCAAMVAIALVPPFVAIAALADAERAVHHARPAEALDALARAGWWMPAIGEDGRYLTQVGSLEAELGMDTALAGFWRATQSDNRGFDLEARTFYLEEPGRARASTALLRECNKALLRQAIDAVNSARPGVAIGIVEDVLAADPCSLKGLHLAQLAYLRNGEAGRVAHARAWLAATYSYFNNPTKDAVIADADENIALAAFSEGRVADAWLAWKTAKRR